MQDTKTAQDRTLALPVEAQAAYLAACLAHVVEAYQRVAGIPDEIYDTVLAPSLEALWQVASGAPFDRNALAQIETDADRIAPELTDTVETDLVHLVSAALGAVERLPGPQSHTMQVLNNLQATVMICDPEEEPGGDEEGAWSDELLSFLERGGPGGPLTRQSLASRIDVVTDWETRFSNDFNGA